MEGAKDVPPILPLLADPLRWRLVATLAGSDLRVGELSDRLGSPQNLVSYHLGELKRAGIVSARRSSADRRDVYYRADLLRCGERLGAVGGVLHRGLRLDAGGGAAGSHRHPPRVLFLCTGNSARSQMAEALAEHRSRHTISARSAGSHPKPLHPNAVLVMAEHGIDISHKETKHLSRFARTRLDRVITLCDKVREVCPELLARRTDSHWSIPDPAAEGDTDDATLPAFRQVADELEVRVGLLIAELAAPPAERTPHAR